MPRCFSAILAILACLPPSLRAGHEMVRRDYGPAKTPSEIRITTQVSQLAPSGYMPVRVYLKNGSKLPRTWSLSFTSTDSSWSDEGNELSSDFNLGCEAGESQVFDILVPLVTAFMKDYGSSTTELDVSASAPGLPPAKGSLSTEFTEEWPSIMISEALANRNGSLLTTAARDKLSRGTHGGMASSIEFGGSFDPKELSGDWRAYVGYDYCLLSEQDWGALSPGARSALLRWNRLGGGLLIYATNPSSDLLSLGIPDMERGPRSVQRSWGVVKLLNLPSNKEMDATATTNLLDDQLPVTTGDHRLQMLRDGFESGWPVQLKMGSKTAHAVFFIIILIAFGILVGPVNLFVFAKAGQRHRLFLTTPIISIGASLILVVLILLQDGFGGRGERVVLMEVRSGAAENALYLSQEQFCRTGVLLSTGFTTSEPGFLTPVILSESRWARVTKRNNGGSSRFTASVEEDGLKVTGDWFKSRSEHGHYLEAIRPSRGRVELQSGTGDPVVTSTFDFPLTGLVYTDRSGTHWEAKELSQGQRTTLTRIEQSDFNRWKADSLAKFTGRNRSRLSMTMGRRGHFLATSDQAPAIETLDSINWTKTHTVLTGSVYAP